MNCNIEQQETAECEKRGCEGCAYNDEIKVGEYVRSLVNGRISKILEISDLLEEPGIKYYKTGNLTGFCSTENYQVKHSFNIIDLIEVRRLCKWI